MSYYNRHYVSKYTLTRTQKVKNSGALNLYVYMNLPITGNKKEASYMLVTITRKDGTVETPLRYSDTNRSGGYVHHGGMNIATVEAGDTVRMEFGISQSISYSTTTSDTSEPSWTFDSRSYWYVSTPVTTTSGNLYLLRGSETIDIGKYNQIRSTDTSFRYISYDSSYPQYQRITGSDIIDTLTSLGVKGNNSVDLSQARTITINKLNSNPTVIELTQITVGVSTVSTPLWSASASDWLPYTSIVFNFTTLSVPKGIKALNIIPTDESGTIGNSQNKWNSLSVKNLDMTWGETPSMGGINSSTGVPNTIGDVSRMRPAVVTESYRNGTSWYRLYSDGWCEQGSSSKIASHGVANNLLYPFKDSNYVVDGNHNEDSGFNFNMWVIDDSKTKTSFKFRMVDGSGRAVNNYSIWWTARGYVELPTNKEGTK